MSSTGQDLNSPVSPRFGRCPYYVIIDTETMAFETIPNTSMDAPSGAGIAAAQAVSQKGVEAVLTGNFGPNASQVLSQVGARAIAKIKMETMQDLKEIISWKIRRQDKVRLILTMIVI